MSLRLKRVEEAIHRELGAIINRTLTFDEGMVTIHDISVTPDLRQCHVYLGVVPKCKDARGVIHKLDDNRTMLQTNLAKRVVLKYTPYLNFHLDDSVERGIRVLQIMDQMPEPLEADDDEEGYEDDDEFYDDEDDDDEPDSPGRSS